MELELISVKDSMPEEYQEVLFFYTIKNYKKDFVCGHYAKGIWHVCYLYTSIRLGDNVNVTHWAKLPEYPK